MYVHVHAHVRVNMYGGKRIGGKFECLEMSVDVIGALSPDFWPFFCH